MAEMVWCKSCKNVVWAYDHQHYQPLCSLRSYANELQLPCPICGKEGNYDGWGSNDFQRIEKALKSEEVYDWWSAMQEIAKIHKVEWTPSGDNRWFR